MTCECTLESNVETLSSTDSNFLEADVCSSKRSSEISLTASLTVFRICSCSFSPAKHLFPWASKTQSWVPCWTGRWLTDGVFKWARGRSTSNLELLQCWARCVRFAFNSVDVVLDLLFKSSVVKLAVYLDWINLAVNRVNQSLKILDLFRRSSCTFANASRSQITARNSCGLELQIAAKSVDVDLTQRD